ncbi:HET-domain-containing protein [Alternaria alternata]|uniref:HET-domain-containing protein n=1 Tax=Alternaria alternata TaxID=5599 RepID=A0A177D6F7_ALTAL|nr:HET-domain-containing protein [Alternaria alternata]OAG14702.1 HET-domain-containing protein [Alternaria alternata]
MMLCEVCSRMFSSGAKGGNHHTSLASFTKAAAEGCYICAPWLKYAMKETGPLEDCLDPRGSYRRSGHYHTSSGTLLLKSSGCGSLEMKMFIKKGGKDLCWSRKFIIAPQAVLPVRTNVYDRGSVLPMNECLPAAQEWMRSCLDKHEQCTKHTQPHTYPTRLLELGGHNCRLILPQDHRSLGPYAALSYCWGPNPSFIRLTADNLQEFRMGLPYTSLPIAFQEAVDILKGLDIRYLWIDALCIIQSGLGSSEDWQFECGRMQEVYSNCIINLSLAQAAHPNQSCLGGYTLDSTLPFEVETVHEGHKHGSVVTGEYTVVSGDYFREALHKQPIGSRAWVMQERLLATRVLSIGHGELFWDCQQVPHASESLPYGFRFCSDIQRNFLKTILDLSIPFIPNTPEDEDLGKTWSKLLEEYTTCKLTYPETDKLAGISAIATRIGYAMNDKYLSGHFLRTLPGSLYWRARRSVLSSSHVEKRAQKRLLKSSGQVVDDEWIITPSWSWASMDGQLEIPVIGDNGTMWPLSIATMDGYRFSAVGQRGPEAQVENKLLLTIRAWCRVFEWRTDLPNGYGDILFISRNLAFQMDDLQDSPKDGSQCLLAVLVHSYSLVAGLLLSEIDFNGEKVYERMGHFRWFGAVGFDDESWKTIFTDGERPITLC